MDEIIPWDEWVGVIAPNYPSGKRGRPPMGIERMLRMYLLQIWFNLFDPAAEDAIYDSYGMCKFTGINFMAETVPDETTPCKFRHLLEGNGPNKLLFEAVNRVMVATGHMVKSGTIVDATIINAPSSTKNAEKARDPDQNDAHLSAIDYRINRRKMDSGDGSKACFPVCTLFAPFVQRFPGYFPCCRCLFVLHATFSLGGCSYP